MYTTGRFVKLKIGLGKARAEFNKKQKLKKHDIERETERDHRIKI
jgi:tmRNA-binding protein